MQDFEKDILKAQEQRKNQIMKSFQIEESSFDTFEKARNVGETMTDKQGRNLVWTKTPSGFDWRMAKKENLAVKEKENEESKNIKEKFENSTVIIKQAVTSVNSLAKKSSATGKSISLGRVIYERYDGLFFANVDIDGTAYRPFYRFDGKLLELYPDSNRKKTILVKEFEKEDKTKPTKNAQTFLDLNFREYKIEGRLNSTFSDDDYEFLGKVKRKELEKELKEVRSKLKKLKPKITKEEFEDHIQSEVEHDWDTFEENYQY